MIFVRFLMDTWYGRTWTTRSMPYTGTELKTRIHLRTLSNIMYNFIGYLISRNVFIVSSIVIIFIARTLSLVILTAILI